MPTTLPAKPAPVGPPPVEPKPVMTFGKSVLILSLSGFFDLARAYFALFIITGPLTVALLSAGVVGNALSFLGSAGSTIAGLVGAAVGGVSIFGSTALEPFGAVMAMIIGIIGFIAVYGMLWMMGVRRERALLRMLFTFVISEVPIIDSIPVLTPDVWSAVRAQQKKDRARREEYEADLAKHQADIAQENQAAVAQIRAQIAAEEEIPDGLPA